jgi:branched-chain amino acid transport system substrate-binding protein
MTRGDGWHLVRGLLGAALVSAWWSASPSSGQDRPTPILDLRTREVEYLGPGRELAPPADLREVHLGWFGPPDEADPEWGDAWRGALLAVEEANAGGGYRGLPFRLVAAWSESPWGSGVADLAKLIFGGGVWAVVGGVDGTTTHLAEQIVVKGRLPLVSPGGTDPSVNFTAVPWMFTLLPTDDRLAPILADAVLGGAGGGAWAVVTTPDRDTRVAWRAVRAVLAARRLSAPAQDLVVPAAGSDYEQAAADVVRSGARAVLVLAGAGGAARIVRALRVAGLEGTVVGGAPVGRRVFAAEAGPAAEGVLFPLLFDPEAPEAAAFCRAYAGRWGGDPDYLAAHAYDAVHLAVDAVRRAGPNRALIRDALVSLAPWHGAAGTVSWDLTGRCVRAPVLGKWSGSRPLPRRRPSAVGRASAARTGDGPAERQAPTGGAPFRPAGPERSRPLVPALLAAEPPLPGEHHRSAGDSEGAAVDKCLGDLAPGGLDDAGERGP